MNDDISTRNSVNGHFKFSIEGSPDHYQRVGLYLKQLRERGETHSCDMTFIVKDGREMVHSTVMAAHSSKIAKMLSTSTSPVVLDMNHYSAYSVRKIIDWMYYGSVSITADSLVDYLTISSELGIVFLHRQLEKILCNQLTQKGRIVDAINIGSSPSTGVSSTGLLEIVQALADRQKKRPFCLEDILLLTLRSVIVLVSSHIKQEDKAALINVALQWLRVNIFFIEKVIRNIVVAEMTECDLNTFRVTLTSAMLNPNIRLHVNVSQVSKNDWLAINVDAMDSYSSPFTTGYEDISTKPSKNEQELDAHNNQHLTGKRLHTQSELDELEALPADGKVFGNTEYRTNSSSTATSWTGSQGSITTKDRSFTKSELKDIEGIPDIFGNEFTKWERNDCKLNSDYSLSSTVQVRNLVEPFEEKSNGRNFTLSELEDIRKLPNLFTTCETKKPILVSSCNNCRGCSTARSQLSFTESTANTISDETLDEIKQMQLKTHGKRDTNDEVELCNLPVSFASTPQKVNSIYANLPKETTMSNSFYAFL